MTIRPSTLLLGLLLALPVPVAAQTGTGDEVTVADLSVLGRVSVSDALDAYRTLVSDLFATATTPESAAAALNGIVEASRALTEAISASGASEAEISEALTAVLSETNASVSGLQSIAPPELIAVSVAQVAVAVVETAAVALSAPQPALAAAINAAVSPVSSGLSPEAVAALDTAVAAVGTGSYEGVTETLSSAVSASAG